MRVYTVINGNETGQGCEVRLCTGDLAMADTDAVVTSARSAPWAAASQPPSHFHRCHDKCHGRTAERVRGNTAQGKKAGGIGQDIGRRGERAPAALDRDRRWRREDLSSRGGVNSRVHALAGPCEAL